MAGEIVVGLVLILGVLGTVLFVFPGLLLQLLAVFIWAAVDGSGVAWATAIASVIVVAAATVLKYLVPGKRMRSSGVPVAVLAPAVILAIVGFFVIPVIGAPIFFVAAVYLIELARVGPAEAWPTTKASVGAVAVSVGIEFAAALLILGLWALAVVLT